MFGHLHQVWYERIQHEMYQNLALNPLMFYWPYQKTVHQKPHKVFILCKDLWTEYSPSFYATKSHFDVQPAVVTDIIMFSCSWSGVHTPFVPTLYSSCTSASPLPTHSTGYSILQYGYMHFVLSSFDFCRLVIDTATVAGTAAVWFSLSL